MLALEHVPAPAPRRGSSVSVWASVEDQRTISEMVDILQGKAL
jgi:hypothetical protein